MVSSNHCNFGLQREARKGVVAFDSDADTHMYTIAIDQTSLTHLNVFNIKGFWFIRLVYHAWLGMCLC